MHNYGFRHLFAMVASFIIGGSAFSLIAQTPTETPPAPGPKPSFSLPAVEETVLPNGLRVVVVRKAELPLVTATLLVKSGASSEASKSAGLATATAAMLRKGANGFSATEFAEKADYLGGYLVTGSNWNSSYAALGVTSDKLGTALSLMSDAVLRPDFPVKELNLYKKQSIADIEVGLKRPGTLFELAASYGEFGEHPVEGSPKTLKGISIDQIRKFHADHYHPDNAVLIFVGDITPSEGTSMARLFFGGWEKSKNIPIPEPDSLTEGPKPWSDGDTLVRKITVVNLPNSGQSAVGYVKRIDSGFMDTQDYYSAQVLHSILGGGYSARLNQEIRLKRGLSYGARSRFGWRDHYSNFLAVAQTKDVSAAEVAELVKIEIEKLLTEEALAPEMKARMAVVEGGFLSSLYTNEGIASQLRTLYAFSVGYDHLNKYLPGVNSIGAGNIKDFSRRSLAGGDIVIAGDASVFMDDLKKRFPGMEIEVIDAKTFAKK